ncbi:bifunctional lycopene cyclase/phytoene synthase-like [Aphidius gifuensis]|nr:bifunctional lycopene cyclase/phytoene synthase-like [Aphidius gifuensis]
MLTYIDVHLIYTLPVIFILSLITWPFINRTEIFKIILISTLAVIYTTPWDTYVIYNGAWTYPPDRVLAVIGWVPIEEYMFFIIQCIITTLWSLLCSRWTIPCFSFNYNKKSYQLIRWIPIILMGIITIIGYKLAIPGQHTFYIGCILWWSCPVLAFMWYGAGNFFIKKIFSSLIAIIIPTLYLWRVDQIALKDNVWHINEKMSLNIFPIDDLPIEEALFFFLTNLFIVMGVHCCDKARGIIDTYTQQFPIKFNIKWNFICQMFRAFLISEYSLSSIVVDDIKNSANVLSIASKSFNTAGYFFQTGIRLDLTILYGFCRVTDDMIDNELNIEKKIIKLKIIKNFINELFSDRKTIYDVKIKPSMININWKKYETKLSNIELSCFRAISRIAFYFPRKPFDELISGYQWDIDGRVVNNEDDLILYSSYVAGSVGALCVHVMMYRSDFSKHSLDKNYNYVIEKAQQMGNVLQMVNIARDIVTDSVTLGRCYVPSEYMDDEIQELKILCEQKNPRLLGDKKLKKYSMRIIKLANKHQSESVNAIRYLPQEVRGSVLAATEIYRGLTRVIVKNQNYPTRAALSKWNKIFIAFYSLYVKSIQYIM